MWANLTERANNVLNTSYGLSDVSITWSRPQDKSHGDIATPVALQIAKQVGKAPRDIAQAIVEDLTQAQEVEKVELAGPGYVNVWLTPTALLLAVDEVETACEAQPTRSNEAPILVEYSSPNIAKPFGIHHILTTVIGQVIANLYRHGGYNTVSINHLGDWGTQFGKVAVAFERWGEKPLQDHSIDDLLALYVRFHAEVEHDDTLEDAGRAAFAKLEAGDEDIRAFWQTAVDITMGELEHTYARMHVHFDHVHGESFYEDKMVPIIEEGKEKGVFIAGKKGALIAEFPEETSMPPAIILKADGSTIYHTRDLATTRYRLDHWHPAKVLYVVGVEQQLYFQQLFAIVEQLGWESVGFEHVSFGRMKFADQGMSTRKGIVLKLQDVLDEAVQKASEVIAQHGDTIQTDDPDDLAEMMGVGSVVYGILSQNRKMDITFDWQKVLSFDGNSAPYLQYTHARARSVLRKAEAEPGVAFPEVGAFQETERLLLGSLLEFPRILEEARRTCMPHLLCTYLFSLCQDFNSFYNAQHILNADEPQRTLRLALTDRTAAVLHTGAELLTLRVPDRM